MNFNSGRDNLRFFTISSIAIIGVAFLTYFSTLNSFFSGPDFSMLYFGKYGKFYQLFNFLLPSVGEMNIRPLPEMSWYLDYRLFGLNPIGYHTVNILMHSVNAVLILFLCIFLSKNRAASLGAALLFAIHPIHSEVVPLIMLRADLMCTLFYLLSLVSFALYFYAQNNRLIYFISVLSYPLALFSKEMALTLPLIIMLYGFFSEKKLSMTSFVNRINLYIPYIAINVLYIVWRLVTTGTLGGESNPVSGKPDFLDFNFLDYIIKAVYYVPKELFISAHPITLKDNLLKPITMLLTLGAAIAIASLLIERIKNIRLILFGFIWILVTLIPTHNILELNNTLKGRKVSLSAFTWILCYFGIPYIGE
jgi:protein O-mannosyl-transferase